MRRVHYKVFIQSITLILILGLVLPVSPINYLENVKELNFPLLKRNLNIQPSNMYLEQSILGSNKISEYIEKAPIKILNDSAFGIAGYNFPGSGSQNDPYIITNYQITNSSDILIYIENTTVYFDLYDCYLDGLNNDYSGIFLKNVTFGNISSSYITNVYRTIELEYSENITIQSVISKSTNYGFRFHYSHNNTLKNNWISNTANYGIYLYYSGWNTFYQNEIQETGTYGIHVERYSYYNDIIDNTITETTLHGIWLRVESYYTDVINNTILNTGGCGIELNHYVTLCKIIGNFIQDPSKAGIRIYSHSKAIIANNTIINSKEQGILLEANIYTISITRNVIINSSSYGMKISYSCNESIVTWNTFLDNNKSGVQAVDGGTNNTFEYNHWNDYIIPDTNMDGLVDNSYSIGVNSDPYPRVAPIWINEDSDFVKFASQGDGTELSPYLLENQHFISAESHLIFIENTSAHFTVQNFHLDGIDQSNSGIYMQNVTHGTIKKIIIKSCSNGILLNSSCNNNTISYTNVELSDNGFNLIESANNTLTYNSAMENDHTGFTVLNSDNISFITNKAEKNSENGFLLTNSQDCFLYKNIALNNENGIELIQCLACEITENEIQENKNSGILLVYSDNNLLFLNLALENGVTGIEIQASDNNKLLSNAIDKNYFEGIKLSVTSEKNILYRNNVTNNAFNGVLLDDVDWNNITENRFIKNKRNGISILNSEFNTIKGNFIEWNENYGMYSNYGNYNYYSENVISHNQGGAGVSFETCTANIVNKSMIWGNSGYGVQLIESIDNIFYFNVFIENGEQPQASDILGTNSWTNGSHGNYWSEHVTTDNNEDGIVDIPYILKGSTINPPTDYYPLVELGIESELMITGPDDLTIEAGTLSRCYITWIATTNLYPTNYQIYEDGVLSQSGNWISGAAIKFEIDIQPLNLGQIYSYSITVMDYSANTVTDEVLLQIVDSTGPEIIYNGNTTIVFEEGSNKSDFQFIFSAKDRGIEKLTMTQDDDLNLGNWSLEESREMMIWNETFDLHGKMDVLLLMFTSNSNEDQVYITTLFHIDLSFLEVENHTLTLKLWDSLGNLSTLTFTIIVTPRTTQKKSPGLTLIISIVAIIIALKLDRKRFRRFKKIRKMMEEFKW